MEFVSRDLVVSDLDQCLALTTDRFLYDERSLGSLRRMWSRVIATKSGTATVLTTPGPFPRVLWFHVAVFVTYERAVRYHQLERPKIAHAMAEELECGGQPFLNREEIARANAGEGMNLVVAHHGYEEQHDASDERLRAATYESGRRVLSGWNMRTYTAEIFARDGERDGREMGEALGFRVKQYAREQLREAAIPNGREPYVWLSTLEDAVAKPAGLALAVLFLSFSRPKFGFNFSEQETLEFALDGHTDEAIAHIMGTSLATIKKRFRAIYEKVEDADTDSNAAISHEPQIAGVRGMETRRKLLNYLRDRREELRPYWEQGSVQQHDRRGG